LQNPTGIFYDTPGTYDVSLTVANEFGTDTETKTDFITVNVLPVPAADFSANQTTIYAGSSVDFTDLSTNMPASWLWTFEGAQTTSSVLQNPSGIFYDTPGTYGVSLTVSNASGSDTKTIANCITVNVLPVPVVDFTANSTTIYAGGAVNFTDLSTNNPSSWLWTFEGAQPPTSTLRNPSNIVYNTPGIYSVSLIATNSFGSGQATKTDYIIVNVAQPLVADFTADKTVIEMGDIVHFADISLGNPVFWTWEIEGGDPALVHLQNPGVVFDTPGSFDVKLTVVRPGATDVEIKTDYIQVNPSQSILPPGWDFVSTSRQHIIAVPLESNPRIHLTQLQPGDYIGVFYNGDDGTPKCGGHVQWDGVSNVPVIAYGDETSTIPKDGFAINEAFQWKMYSVSMAREFDATVQYDLTMTKRGNFFPFGLSALTDIYSGDVFNIIMPSGWSSISSPIDPWEKEFNSLFSPVISDLVLLYNYDGMLWPGTNINTLINWNNQSGYNIKLVNPGIVEFLGYPEKRLMLPIPQGWSFLPIPVGCEVDVASLFSTQLSNLIIVREPCGFNLYWPQYNINTLGTLQPGKAYLIDAANSFSIQFQPCSGTMKNSGAMSANTLQLNSDWNPLSANASVHTFAVTAQACNQLKTGDILGAFTSEGICSGMARFEGKEFAISVFGDDATTTANDGFAQDEPVNFKLYRPTGNLNFELKVSCDKSLPDQDKFNLNGLSVIREFKLLTISDGNDGATDPAIYPNPSDGKFMVTGIRQTSGIIVRSIDWQQVMEINLNGSDSRMVDMSAYPKGIYFVCFETSNGILVRKIVID